MSYNNPSCQEEASYWAGQEANADADEQAQADAFAADADREMGIDESFDDVGCK